MYVIVHEGYLSSKRGDNSWIEGHGYLTYESAEKAAKKAASTNKDDVHILQAMATAKAIIPEIEVVKLNITQG